MMSTKSTSWSTIEAFLKKSDSKTVSCFQQIQWGELCRIASSLAGMECAVLDQVASGLNNVVRLLEFSNKKRWVARIHISRNSSSTFNSTRLETEVSTMQFIREHSDIPVPNIFAYKLDEDNPVGVAYVLMELLPGSVAMDTHGGYEAHRGAVPKELRQPFYQSVAKHHTQITSLRLPKIGTIHRTPNGEYECGPIPGIGGPFDTAAEFFETWAETVKFEHDREKIIQMMDGAPFPAEEMVQIIENFPAQIKAIASRISSSPWNEGPFPLRHNDFYHSNIMVDEDTFDVTGIIDWEGACTLPWELVSFPEFLSAMPMCFDLPDKYDQFGLPVDEDLKERWRERGEYVDMVRSVEHVIGCDCLLSTCLSSKRMQTIAYSYWAYTDIGKLGFYDRVVKEIEL